MEALDLADYRLRVAELYARARGADDPEAAWADWRAARDDLLGTHPQTPVAPENRPAFTGMPFFPYDPDWRLELDVTPIDGDARVVDGWQPVGTVSVAGHDLTLFWLTTYGGGLFLPFRDATSGTDTYGGGRYVLDTVKGADHGRTPDGRLVVDFNFAYHPSCAHDPRWTCPLAPPENRLAVPVRAGEMLPR